MKFRLEFTVPDDSSDDADTDIDITNAEIVFVLDRLNRRFQEYSSNHIRTVLDSNGNTVGSWDLIPDA